ncbi:MAG: RtcB family protein [Marinilabiliaceae bacterium]|nr:RtcB family protein [Marinilabiliaceae bacterium]
MKEVNGKYSSAKIFTNNVDDVSMKQIETLCNQEFTAGAKIRLMPDVHAGAGCTIGTTMTITDKIVPNLVGVDIGCGMETVMLKADSEAAQNFNPTLLDTVIRRSIPCGFDIRKEPHPYSQNIEFEKVRGQYSKARALRSVGTLGGGNHFIEADRDDDGNLYFVVHSGSRHAGLEIANYYQEEAWKQLNHNQKKDLEELINQLKAEHRENEIQDRLTDLKTQIITDVPKDLAYVSGSLFDDYINDMGIMQHFAMMSRKAMMDEILNGLGIRESEIQEQFTTIHNYIDISNMILRKGAVSAQNGEKLLIPINMRDGSLICVGKGNTDWNCSAPHGAGRIMSRRMARKTIDLEEFKAEMAGIYSTTVNLDTIDEAPMAYKTMDDIVANISPTADIVKIIKPVFNFKAGDE